jgi:pre-mRNA-splicing factor SYF1
MFNVYIARATEFFGVTRTREIFEKAIQILPEKYVKGNLSLPLSSPQL